MKQHYLKTCGGFVFRGHFRRVVVFFSSGYFWQSKYYTKCCKHPSKANTIEATHKTNYAGKYIRNYNHPKRKQICSFVAVVRQWILISVLNFWLIGKYPNIAFRYKKIIINKFLSNIGINVAYGTKKCLAQIYQALQFLGRHKSSTSAFLKYRNSTVLKILAVFHSF